MLTIKAAIFDLDGVIVDTARYHFLAWQRLAARLGFEFTAADNERLKGVSRMRSLELVLEVGGITASEAEQLELADQKNRWYLEYIQGISPAELLPGVIPCINYLRNHGIKIALGSASKNANLILEKLQIRELFDAVVDGNQVSQAKPDPEVFLVAARLLDTEPSQCIVFEDAAAGVAAAKQGGMTVVGLGTPDQLNQADLVIPDFTVLDFGLVAGATTDSEFLLTENSFIPENIELNGSKFGLANGYLGYRGTLDEFSKAELVACTLAGFYDRKDQKWREPVNAPNGLHTTLFYENQALLPTQFPPEQHCQCLDLRRGVHRRATLFPIGPNAVWVESERFLSLDNLHLIVLRYCFRLERPGRIVIQTGIDGQPWEINGPHFTAISTIAQENQLLSVARTNEGGTVAVAELLVCDFGTAEISTNGQSIYHLISLDAEAQREYCFYKYVSVYTSQDAVADPGRAAMANNAAASRAGYASWYLRQAQRWQERWLESDVVLKGDPTAQFGLRYSLYQLLAIAPTHSEKLSIPARGLSGQTYKGAVFWDTELFMLPFLTYTQPRLARNTLKYRYHTLAGARRKAKEYGYRGAFYAWESQETGDDACTLFNVTDVFTGRPIRTYFRDRQIHINADIVYALWQYYLITGDRSILTEGGAAVILECARFFYSYAYFKPEKNRFEILEVTGPDEYHERVSNNAFTNYLIKYALEIALTVIELLKKEEPEYYEALIAQLELGTEIAQLEKMRDLLYLPQPHPQTAIIDQFDGYQALEDLSLAELKARIKNPHEYLGGGNGLATTTQILKQADVVALLYLFKHSFSPAVKQANWEYYEPRTEHGSSLSSCIYAIVAADLGKPDWAYPYFMKTATLDLTGDYKRYVGDLYIGGTHPAANGGAWMATVLGFAGVSFDGQTLTVKPALPSHWQSLAFRIKLLGQPFQIEITAQQIKLTAATALIPKIRFNLAGQSINVKPGETVTVNYQN